MNSQNNIAQHTSFAPVRIELPSRSAQQMTPMARLPVMVLPVPTAMFTGRNPAFQNMKPNSPSHQKATKETTFISVEEFRGFVGAAQPLLGQLNHLIKEGRVPSQKVGLSQNSQKARFFR